MGTICLDDYRVLMTPEFIAEQSKTELNFGDWRPGRYAWKFENIHPINSPKIKGHQGLWSKDIKDFGTLII